MTRSRGAVALVTILVTVLAVTPALAHNTERVRDRRGDVDVYSRRTNKVAPNRSRGSTDIAAVRAHYGADRLNVRTRVTGSLRRSHHYQHVVLIDVDGNGKADVELYTDTDLGSRPIYIHFNDEDRRCALEGRTYDDGFFVSAPTRCIRGGKRIHVWVSLMEYWGGNERGSNWARDVVPAETRFARVDRH